MPSSMDSGLLSLLCLSAVVRAATVPHHSWRSPPRHFAARLAGLHGRTSRRNSAGLRAGAAGPLKPFDGEEDEEDASRVPRAGWEWERLKAREADESTEMRACRASSGELCPFAAMPANEPTLVYPGGRTRCLFSSTPDYAFQVTPGSKERLLLVFGAGGACWSKLTATVIHSCYKTEATGSQPRGVLSRTDDNPFADYTVVQIKYCSGDLHAGNATQRFKDGQGALVEQRGYYNTRSAIDWVKANLGTRFESFVMLGHSAGAIGAQLLAEELLGEFQYDRASVIADSWASVFPAGFEGHVFKALGMCPVGFLKGNLSAACEAEALRISDVWDAAMKAFPHVAFAMVNSKYDFGQIAYYKLATLTMRHLRGVGITGRGYLQELNAILRRFDKNPNFVSYVKTGREHIFLDGYARGRMQGTSIANLRGERSQLLDWLRGVSAAKTGSARSICDQRSRRDPCDVEQAGKVLVLAAAGGTEVIPNSTALP